MELEQKKRVEVEKSDVSDGCTSRIAKLFWNRSRAMMLTCILSFVDFVSDWIVIVTWFSEGHYGWASIMLFFIIISTIFVYLITVTKWLDVGIAVRLDSTETFFYVLGLSTYIEALRYLLAENAEVDDNAGDTETDAIDYVTLPETNYLPKERLTKQQSNIMQKIRRARMGEVALETGPCGALQLYVMIVSNEVSWIQILSLSVSIVVLGHAVAGILKVMDVAHRKGMKENVVYVAAIISLDFLWRAVPIALFLTVYTELYWKFVIPIICTIPCVFNFHLRCSQNVPEFGGTLKSWWSLSDCAVWSVLNLFSISIFLIHVLDTWVYSEEYFNSYAGYKQLWLSSFSRIAINMGFLIPVVLEYDSLSSLRKSFVIVSFVGLLFIIPLYGFIQNLSTYRKKQEHNMEAEKDIPQYDDDVLTPTIFCV